MFMHTTMVRLGAKPGLFLQLLGLSGVVQVSNDNRRAQTDSSDFDHSLSSHASQRVLT